MARSRASRTLVRRRIGRVSVYEHHGSWHTYHREESKAVRRRVGEGEAWAECLASLLNARLVAEHAGVNLSELLSQVGLQTPSPMQTGAVVGLQAIPEASGLAGVDIPTLRKSFLAHHEKVLGSAVGTVSRYSTATLHLERFAATLASQDVMAVPRDAFINYLRNLEVSPNGHPNSPKRRLREKGIVYILETCRSMYHHGLRQGLIPRQLGNPFADASVAKIRVRDSKPVFLFTPQAELAFFAAADPWSFAVHFTLAKTGVRRGELRHLLVEDLDLENGWLHVRGKPELGWNVKTNRERRVPLLPEVVDLQHRRDAPPLLFFRRRQPRRAGPSGGHDDLGGTS